MVRLIRPFRPASLGYLWLRTGLKLGLAKFEHNPGEAFMRLFVDVCAATELKDFNPQNLANTINGEARIAFPACIAC
jgi:hypothetical protein